MAVRLIEVFLPADRLLLARSSISGKEVLSVWTEKLSEGKAQLHILAESECSEEITDALRNALADSGDEMRIISLPVEAAIPSPDEVEKKTSLTVTPHHSRKFRRVSREELYTDVSEMMCTSRSNLFMIILSAIVVTVGFAQDNVAVIIGAMVIAPLLGPNVGLALGATLGDVRLITNALNENIRRIGIALLFALLAGYIVEIDPSMTQLSTRAAVHYGDIAVALAAGAAGALALSTGAPATLIGVMVAAALMPPLVAMGVYLGEWSVQGLVGALGALHLLMINLISINLSGVLTFLAIGFRPWKKKDTAAARKSSIIALVIWVILLVTLGVLISYYPN